MPDLTAAEAYAREHLAELAREWIDWTENEIEPGPALDRLFAMTDDNETDAGIAITRNLIVAAALEFAARGGKL